MKKFGNLSKKYLGIAAHFTYQWFDQTSHSGERNTRHPTIRPLRRLEAEQARLLGELRKAGLKHRFSGEQITAQWEMLVEESTKVATDHLRQNWLTWNGNPIPWCEDSEDAVIDAGHSGLGHMSASVHHLARHRDKWHCVGEMTFRLPLTDPKGEVFYVRTNGKSKGGKTQFKIGKTTARAKAGRDNAYSVNAGPGNTQIVYEIDADEILNEGHVRMLLASMGVERMGRSKDWFRLDQWQSALLCDPDQLRVALADFMKENR